MGTSKMAPSFILHENIGAIKSINASSLVSTRKKKHFDPSPRNRGRVELAFVWTYALYVKKQLMTKRIRKHDFLKSLIIDKVYNCIILFIHFIFSYNYKYHRFVMYHHYLLNDPITSSILTMNYIACDLNLA